MGDEIKAPQSVLEQILEEMFQKLEEEEDFDLRTLEELKLFADKNSLNKVDEILELFRGEGDADEDP